MYMCFAGISLDNKLDSKDGIRLFDEMCIFVVTMWQGSVIVEKQVLRDMIDELSAVYTAWPAGPIHKQLVINGREGGEQ